MALNYSSGSGIGGSRAAKFAGAMEGMNSKSFGLPDPEQGLAGRMQAMNKANAWKNQGIEAYGGMANQMTDMTAQAAGEGINLLSNAKINKFNKDASEAAMAAQSKASSFGAVAQGIGIIAGLFCERRLKTNIASLDHDAAWTAVRDLPLYSFSYKANPAVTVYGPMIDEVEPLDPSLVRPSILPDDEEGPIRSFDVLRHQAYQALALQQALLRIEALEQRLAAYERFAVAPRPLAFAA